MASPRVPRRDEVAPARFTGVVRSHLSERSKQGPHARASGSARMQTTIVGSSQISLASIKDALLRVETPSD